LGDIPLGWDYTGWGLALGFGARKPGFIVGDLGWDDFRLRVFISRGDISPGF